MQALFFKIVLFFGDSDFFSCSWGNFGTDLPHPEEIVLAEGFVNDNCDSVLSDFLLQIVKQV